MDHPLASLTAQGVDERASALLEKVLLLLREGQPD